MFTYLIIDDEELTRKGTIKKLSPLAETVTCIGEAQDGREGMEMIARLHPDIVVLDMQMPVMDGSALLPWLAEHYPDLPLIVISGYRNFDYIKHAISANAVDYVLKPFSREEIQKCMKSAISRLVDKSELEYRLTSSQEEKETALYEYDLQLLRSLLLGYQTELPGFSSRRLTFLNQAHCYTLFSAYFTRDPELPALQSWIEANGLTDLMLPLPDGTDRQILHMLVFLPEDSVISITPYFRNIAEEFLSFAEQQGNPPLLGISTSRRSLSQLKDARDEAASALGQQELSDVPPKYYLCQDHTPRTITWEHQEEFLFRLESGNVQEVRALTDQLFSYYQKLRGFTLADAKYHCYLLSDECRRILSEYLPQLPLPEKSDSIQRAIGSICHVSQLHRYYLQFFVNLASLLGEKTVYAQEDVIENIKIYLERNYQKDLTQEFISTLFYINRSYLSTLFKARTGEKFTDYLNGIRIEKARELLSGTDRKMYHIAKAVGYDNVKYFFRIFKKKTGMTPEQYRERQS